MHQKQIVILYYLDVVIHKMFTFLTNLNFSTDPIGSDKS